MKNQMNCHFINTSVILSFQYDQKNHRQHRHSTRNKKKKKEEAQSIYLIKLLTLESHAMRTVNMPLKLACTSNAKWTQYEFDWFYFRNGIFHAHAIWQNNPQTQSIGTPLLPFKAVVCVCVCVCVELNTFDRFFWHFLAFWCKWMWLMWTSINIDMTIECRHRQANGWDFLPSDD